MSLTATRHRESIRAYLLASAESTRTAADQCAGDLAKAARLIADAFRAGSKLLICGNGGSAADAQHIATEFTSTLTRSFVRDPLPAIALTTDTSFLTAFSNDFGFDDVFSRQVMALGRKSDVLLSLSTSGNSVNVVRAAEAAKRLGMSAIAFTGSGGGKLAPIADIAIRVPADTTGHIQETHVALYHAMCFEVEEMLFPGRGGTA